MLAGSPVGRRSSRPVLEPARAGRRRARGSGARTSPSSRRSPTRRRRPSGARARRAGSRDGLALPARRSRSGGGRDETALAHARTAHRSHLRARRSSRPSSELRSRRVYPRQAPPLSATRPIDAHRRRLLRLQHLGRSRATWRCSSSSSSGSRPRSGSTRTRVAASTIPWLVAMAALLGLVPPSSGRSSTSSFVLPTRSRSGASASSRTARSRSGSPSATSAARLPRRGRTSFLVCPVCTTRLKQACGSCGSPLEPIWQACPYCATPVPPAAVSGASRCSRCASAARADRADRAPDGASD